MRFIQFILGLIFILFLLYASVADINDGQGEVGGADVIVYKIIDQKGAII